MTTSIGAITVIQKASGLGPVNHDLLSFVGDSAYPTGGTVGIKALLQAALGRGQVQPVAVVAQDCGGYAPVYDFAHDKLKVFYNDNNNAADGPAIEVPATTDLSGITFHVLVISE